MKTLLLGVLLAIGCTLCAQYQQTVTTGYSIPVGNMVIHNVQTSTVTVPRPVPQTLPIIIPSRIFQIGTSSNVVPLQPMYRGTILLPAPRVPSGSAYGTPPAINHLFTNPLYP